MLLVAGIMAMVMMAPGSVGNGGGSVVIAVMAVEVVM